MAAQGGGVQRDLRAPGAANFPFLFIRRQVPDLAATPAILSVSRFQQLPRFHFRTCRGSLIRWSFSPAFTCCLDCALDVELSRKLVLFVLMNIGF